MVHATPVYSPFNYWTWLPTGVCFIERIIAYGEILKSHRRCLMICTWVHPEFIILQHFNFICIWTEASYYIFSTQLVHWETRFCMHNELQSQQNRILKLSSYSLTHTHTYKYNKTHWQATQREAYCFAICQEILSKTRIFCGDVSSYGINVNYNTTSNFPPTDLSV
jgi:hypothetical protein